ncbi:MAG: hypothetical protein ACPGSM_05015 [Thiolinea sp.]
MTLPAEEDCLYQSCYCEENIWHLCQHPACNGSTVVFIASQGEMFPMLCQKAMSDPATPVCWDYHVILLLPGKPSRILDFDTALPFCTELNTYLHRSFPQVDFLPAEYQPYFRLIPTAEFISTFRSDRSHMRTATGWSAPPPDWPIIGSGGSNLTDFRTMTEKNHQHNASAIGKVLSFQEMLTYDEI